MSTQERALVGGYNTFGNQGEANADVKKKYPIINPYTTDLNELNMLRLKASAPRKKFIEAIKKGQIEAPNDLARYVFLGEKGPNLTKMAFPPSPPPDSMDYKEVKELLTPVYNRFIKNIQDETTDMPYEPYLKNAHDTYCDQAVFEAEVRALQANYLIACCTGDVADNRFFQTTMNHKKVLLLKDSKGYHAYNNTVGTAGPDVSNWYAAGDVQDLNLEGLKELPCGVKCGILLVLTHPENLAPEDAMEESLNNKLENVFNKKLQRELSAYGIGKNRATVMQQIAVDANWKMAVDTFGESYHFEKLHATTLKDSFMCNRLVYRSFDDDRDGSPGNSSMVLGRFTMQLLADGDLPEGPENLLSHMIPTFVLAYNTVFFPQPNGVFMSQIWPMDGPGKCMTTLANMSTRLPADQERVVSGFGGILDIFATEDFKILPQMQANFQANKHAETIFGRHEPCLTYRHKLFAKLAELGRIEMRKTAKTPKKVAIASRL